MIKEAFSLPQNASTSIDYKRGPMHAGGGQVEGKLRGGDFHYPSSEGSGKNGFPCRPVKTLV